MEAKNNSSLIEKESKANLLKQGANNLLINYFNYLTWLLAVIVFIIGSLLVIYPQYKKITANREETKKKLVSEYESKYSRLNQISVLQKAYLEISEEDRKKIQEMIPADDKATNLIPEIESIISRNGAVLNSIKIEPVEAGAPANAAPGAAAGEKTAASLAGIFSGALPAGVKLIKIEISFDSVSYQVLKNILKSLENNLRLFDIANISYTPQSSSAALIIYSYYLAEAIQPLNQTAPAGSAAKKKRNDLFDFDIIESEKFKNLRKNGLNAAEKPVPGNRDPFTAD